MIDESMSAAAGYEMLYRPDSAVIMEQAYSTYDGGTADVGSGVIRRRWISRAEKFSLVQLEYLAQVYAEVLVLQLEADDARMASALKRLAELDTALNELSLFVHGNTPEMEVDPCENPFKTVQREMRCKMEFLERVSRAWVQYCEKFEQMCQQAQSAVT